MFNLTKAIPNLVLKLPKIDTRRRCEFYPSDALSDPRDLYWKLTGEPETDSTDFLGVLRMMMGDLIEQGLRDRWLARLHIYGIHLIDYQIKMGHTKIDANDPEETWNGYADFFISVPDKNNPDPERDAFGVEFKTKWGVGANMLWMDPVPSEEYLAQCALYAKNMYDSGRHRDWALLYCLISDNPQIFGQLVQFSMIYDPKTETLKCNRYWCSDGREGALDIDFSIKRIYDNWAVVRRALDSKTLPESKYKYKLPLTPEVLKNQSDKILRDCLEGKKIIGDWQIAYSRYKTKHLKMNNDVLSYTPTEIALIREEYLRRHPKSKK